MRKVPWVDCMCLVVGWRPSDPEMAISQCQDSQDMCWGVSFVFVSQGHGGGAAGVKGSSQRNSPVGNPLGPL